MTIAYLPHEVDRLPNADRVRATIQEEAAKMADDIIAKERAGLSSGKKSIMEEIETAIDEAGWAIDSIRDAVSSIKRKARQP